MRYLVTGGAGFIGSHLCDLLLSRGDAVHVLDDLSTGDLENVQHLRAQPGFEVTVDSCTSAPVVDELVASADAVFHLAAAVGVELIVDSPVRTIETNIRCTEAVLAAAVRRQTPVLLASSSEVYGKSAALPFHEDGDLVLGPTSRGRWSYACSKAVDEFLALAYAKERRLPTTVVRLFNTVGPRQTGRYGMVVPRFVRSALADRDVHVHGDGTQTRCFCHVADVVAALVAAMEAESCVGRVVNVGSTEEVAIAALAERVVRATESSSAVVNVRYEDAYDDGFEDMPRRVPDITRARDLLGWAPTRSLDEIIADVVTFERTRLGA